MKKICVFIVFVTASLAMAASASYTSSEALSRMHRLTEQGKIPAYILERGTYKYVEGNSAVRVTGTNVFMRSQPNTKARIIAKYSRIELEYLGEWTHPANHERWVCVKNSAGDIGWIYGQYIDFVKEKPKKATQTSKKYGEIFAVAFWGFVIVAYIFDDKKKGDSSKSATNSEQYSDIETVDMCCPGYKNSMCEYCGHLAKYDHPITDVTYSKCNHFGGYVKPSRTPQYNARNVQDFSEVCCPHYRKERCEYCPLLDTDDEYYGYYKCRYFYAYVDADYSPQYNSKNLKHR